MKGISYLTNEAGDKKAVVIDIKLLKDLNRLLDKLEEISDEIDIHLRKDEPSFNLKDVRDSLLKVDFKITEKSEIA